MLLSLRDVTKTYPAATAPVLSGVSLDLERGQMLLPGVCALAPETTAPGKAVVVTRRRAIKQALARIHKPLF